MTITVLIVFAVLFAVVKIYGPVIKQP